MPEAKVGYTNIARLVSQFAEVESVRLMSGDYDLSVTVKCADFKQVALFVAERLSSISGVLSTATHFIIGRYKQHGEILDFDEEDERGFVSP
jgi:DNA-binding Lrp family transcriptional regulator